MYPILRFEFKQFFKSKMMLSYMFMAFAMNAIFLINTNQISAQGKVFNSYYGVFDVFKMTYSVSILIMIFFR